VDSYSGLLPPVGIFPEESTMTFRDLCFFPDSPGVEQGVIIQDSVDPDHDGAILLPEFMDLFS